MKKNLLTFAMILGIVAILFYACTKDRSVATYQAKTTEVVGNQKLHTMGGPYIDTIMISNPGQVYYDAYDFYDTIYTYHTHVSSTIHVTVTSIYNGVAVYYGSETFDLVPTHPSHLSYGLENAMNTICSRATSTGIRVETYNLSITRVTDNNGNEITDQVLIIPGPSGLNAHVQGNCFGPPDTSKCVGCGGIPIGG